MKKSVLFLSLLLLSAQAQAAPSPLTVKLDGLEKNGVMPPRFAFCAPDDTGKTKDGGNINPGIEWSGAPEGTKSFALIVVDRDVPATFELANQAGKVIHRNFPRQDFYHWVLVDIDPNMVGIQEGADSNGVVKTGKPVGKRPYGTNGLNDYGKVFGGNFGGYDGPCPPWNDMRLHRYRFIVYALDVPTLGLIDPISGAQAEDVMKDHILARGEAVGVYAINASAQ